MTGISAFEDAKASVESWLDGRGADFARRIRVGTNNRSKVWEVTLGVQHEPVKSFRISLPDCFPSAPCEVYVDERLCLELPHVEEDGRVCLGSDAPPRAYEDGAWAAHQVLERFMRDFLERIKDPAWIQQELQAERLSYWARHCDRAAARASIAPKSTWLDLPSGQAMQESGWQRGAVAAYVRPHSQTQRIQLQLITGADVDPNELAQRHQWASGGLLRGEAVLVRLPDQQAWTPSIWPTTFEALQELVARSTSGDLFLDAWLTACRWSTAGLKRRKQQVTWKQSGWSDVPPGYEPRIVVLLDSTTPYAFHIGPPPAPLAGPTITPLKVTRVDRRWALSRDHETPALDARQGKRVLLVGCGSLGGPVAELLARAGVGHLDIVDPDLLEVPNVARHILGLSSVGQSKAKAAAERIRELIPGLAVHGHQASIDEWLARRSLDVEYDLVVDCTGESSVRTFLSAARPSVFGPSRLIHAWIEPFCSAAHVVATTWAEPWPMDDPADSRVNAADFGPRGGRVDLPACNAGFHPYGAADVAQAAAFVSERLIGMLDGLASAATVYSWVRAKAFFDALPAQATLRPIVPIVGSRFSAATLERALASVLES